MPFSGHRWPRFLPRSRWVPRSNFTASRVIPKLAYGRTSTELAGTRRRCEHTFAEPVLCLRLWHARSRLGRREPCLALVRVSFVRSPIPSFSHIRLHAATRQEPAPASPCRHNRRSGGRAPRIERRGSGSALGKNLRLALAANRFFSAFQHTFRSRSRSPEASEASRDPSRAGREPLRRRRKPRPVSKPGSG